MHCPSFTLVSDAPDAPGRCDRGDTGRRGVSRSRITRALVGAQVALSLVLLVSAGLLTRSMRALSRVDPGFAAENLLTTLGAELDEPTHYDQHRLCKRWGRAAGPP